MSMSTVMSTSTTATAHANIIMDMSTIIMNMSTIMDMSTITIMRRAARNGKSS